MYVPTQAPRTRIGTSASIRCSWHLVWMQQLHCTRADRARRRTPLLLPHYEARTEHDVLESCTDCACCREGGGACAKPSDAALVCWLQEQGELSFLSSLPHKFFIEFLWWCYRSSTHLLVASTQRGGFIDASSKVAACTHSHSITAVPSKMRTRIVIAQE